MSRSRSGSDGDLDDDDGHGEPVAEPMDVADNEEEQLAAELGSAPADLFSQPGADDGEGASEAGDLSSLELEEMEGVGERPAQ